MTSRKITTAFLLIALLFILRVESAIPISGAQESGQSAPCQVGFYLSLVNRKYVCVSKCGDGIVVGNQVCDDKNTKSDDGCSSTCQVEPLYECTTDPTTKGPSVCKLKCILNGKIQSSEVCDDGDTDDTNGCSNLCQVNLGWWCMKQLLTTQNAYASKCSYFPIPQCAKNGVAVKTCSVCNANYVLSSDLSKCMLEIKGCQIPI